MRMRGAGQGKEAGQRRAERSAALSEEGVWDARSRRVEVLLKAPF